MRVFGMKVHIIILAFVLTAGLLLGGDYLYQKYQVDSSLVERVEHHEAVAAARVERQNGRTRVEVHMARVDDLQSSYEHLQELTASVLDPGNVEFEIIDQRNDKLCAAYEDIQFFVLEAASTGRFSVLHGKPDELKAKWSLSGARISASSDNIYVELHDGDHYMYVVVPRVDQPNRGDANS